MLYEVITAPITSSAMGIYVMGPSLGTIAALSLTNSVFMPAFGGYWRMVLWVAREAVDKLGP